MRNIIRKDETLVVSEASLTGSLPGDGMEDPWSFFRAAVSVFGMPCIAYQMLHIARGKAGMRLSAGVGL